MSIQYWWKDTDRETDKDTDRGTEKDTDRGTEKEVLRVLLCPSGIQPEPPR